MIDFSNLHWVILVWLGWGGFSLYAAFKDRWEPPFTLSQEQRN